MIVFDTAHRVVYYSDTTNPHELVINGTFGNSLSHNLPDRREKLHQS